MKAALLQITSSDDPEENAHTVSTMIAEAAEGGAEFVLTPEVSNFVSFSRTLQNERLHREENDPFLTAMRHAARTHKVWLSVGSLALKTDDPEGRFANRSFVISPLGEITARYDKLHMFDVAISNEETYRESAGFRPGSRAVIAPTSFGTLGLSICYDLRFPYLYRALAHAGADILLVPSAFSPQTGAAHWESLLRARAIETGSYVLASAQTGTHKAETGKPRTTYGHTMAISPWGEILGDQGTDIGILMVDLDRDAVSKARSRLPSLSHDRAFQLPNE